MIDLTIKRHVYVKSSRTIQSTITPRTAKGTAWLSQKIFYTKWDPVIVQLDKPVTLSLDGAVELDTLARHEGLHTEGL
jgi:hypothetical protein